MQNRLRSLPSRFVLILAILIGSSVVRADVTGSIQGVVRDRSRGAIVGAQLTITNVETNLRYQATINLDGLYRIPTVPADDYKLSVTASGFRTFVKTDIVVKVNDQLQETQAVSNAAGYQWA
jgi:hypothetical protein